MFSQLHDLLKQQETMTNSTTQALKSDFPAQLQDLIHISTKNTQGLNTLQLIISLPAYPFDIVSSQTVLLYSYSWPFNNPTRNENITIYHGSLYMQRRKWTSSTDYSEV